MIFNCTCVEDTKINISYFKIYLSDLKLNNNNTSIKFPGLKLAQINPDFTKEYLEVIKLVQI